MVLRIPSASILRTTVTLTVKFLSRQYSYSSGLRINVPTALPELHAPPHSVHAPQESDIASHVHGYLRSAHNMHQDRLARKEHRQRPALRAGRLALPARPHGRTHRSTRSPSSSMSASTSGCRSSPGQPRKLERSVGPKKTKSTCGTARMASRFAAPSVVSIWTPTCHHSRVQPRPAEIDISAWARSVTD